MILFDSHVHFHFSDFDPDRAEAIERARNAGVQYFLNVGTDIPSSRASLEFAQKYPYFYAAAGIHPNDAAQAKEEDFPVIEEMVKDKKCLAIGEVGLDFYRDHSSPEIQERILVKFIEMHKRTKKPFVIHCREAYDRLLEVFRRELQPPYDGVMHCFTADAPTARKCVERGFYISFAGPLTYKKNDPLREACRECPVDRILIETDAPFLAPQSHRGKRNEPSFMVQTAQIGAGLHGLSLEAFSEQTTQNAKRLFRL